MPDSQCSHWESHVQTTQMTCSQRDTDQGQIMQAGRLGFTLIACRMKFNLLAMDEKMIHNLIPWAGIPWAAQTPLPLVDSTKIHFTWAFYFLFSKCAKFGLAPKTSTHFSPAWRAPQTRLAHGGLLLVIRVLPRLPGTLCHLIICTWGCLLPSPCLSYWLQNLSPQECPAHGRPWVSTVFPRK